MWRKLLEAAGAFPPGRVPLLLLILAIFTGGAITLRSATEHDKPIRVWTFTYLAYEEFTGTLADHPLQEQVAVRNLGTAMFDRLALAIMTRTELPDLVEVEQSRVGRYLRGRPEHIPFVDLTDRLKREGWYGKIVPARFARYSVEGRIFGMPHDLHPIVLVYRPDVLAELGATPADLATWDGFIDVAQRFYRPGRRGGPDWRYAIGLQTSEGWDFLMLLWQRGGDVFDAQGDIRINDEIAVDTLHFFVSLFTMDPPVAGPKLSDWSEDFRALARGQYLVYAAPDWMLAAMQIDTKMVLEGKVRCLPLPTWSPGGRQTSTLGGTAMLIPEHAGDPNQAWALAKDLYCDHDALIARFRQQSIVPPLTTIYDDPAFDEPSAFFQGQRIGRLLTRLALDVPPVNGSPYAPEAIKFLDIAIPAVLGGDRTPQAALDEVAEKLQAVMARDRAAIRTATGE